jgi:hypothetical protein
MDGATVRDNFDHDTHRWDPLPSTASISGGYLTIKAPKGQSYHVFHDGVLRDATICTTLFSAAGLAFWAVYTPSDKNLRQYAFFVTPSGKFRISRLDHDKWTILRATTRSSAIRTGSVPAFNMLTVRLAGNTPSFYINENKVAELRETPPANASYSGVIVETDTSERGDVSWRFGYYGVAP